MVFALESGSALGKKGLLFQKTLQLVNSCAGGAVGRCPPET